MNSDYLVLSFTDANRNSEHRFMFSLITHFTISSSYKLIGVVRS